MTALLSKLRWLSVWFIWSLTACCAIPETFFTPHNIAHSYTTCHCTHPATHPHIISHILYMVLRLVIFKLCHAFLWLTAEHFVTTVGWRNQQIFSVTGAGTSPCHSTVYFMSQNWITWKTAWFQLSNFQAGHYATLLFWSSTVLLSDFTNGKVVFKLLNLLNRTYLTDTEKDECLPVCKRLVFNIYLGGFVCVFIKNTYSSQFVGLVLA